MRRHGLSWALVSGMALLSGCPRPAPEGTGGYCGVSGCPRPAPQGTGGHCGDTQSDADNCGVCGHACEGGICLVGACVPHAVVLFQGIEVEPYAQYTGLALDAENVYWRDQPNGIGSVPIAGGQSRIIWWSPHSIVGGIAVRGDQVYWSATGGIYSAAKTASMVQPAPLESGGGWGLGADDTFVYWTDYSGGIRRSLVDGGAPILLVASPQGPWDVALDEAHVYWTNVDETTVNRVPKDGGAPTMLAVGQPGVLPHGLAVDATNVYWAIPSDGTVMMRPLAGGQPIQLASGEVGASSVATDGVYVYWGLPTSLGELRRVPIGGGNVTTLGVACPPASCTANWSGAGLVVVDDHSVYWTTASDIVKVAK